MTVEAEVLEGTPTSAACAQLGFLYKLMADRGDGAVSEAERRKLHSRVSSLFYQLAGGADARDVFGQRRREKSRMSARDFAIVHVYWSVRVTSLSKKGSRGIAAEITRRLLRLRGYRGWNLPDPRIHEIAYKNRDAAFAYMDPEQVQKIREHLRKKSARPTKH
jgi:hypothetical protein